MRWPSRRSPADRRVPAHADEPSGRTNPTATAETTEPAEPTGAHGLGGHPARHAAENHSDPAAGGRDERQVRKASKLLHRGLREAFTGRPAAAHQFRDAIVSAPSVGDAVVEAWMLLEPYVAQAGPMSPPALHQRLSDAGLAGHLRELDPHPCSIGALGQRHSGIWSDHRPVSVHITRPGAAAALSSQLAAALAASRTLSRALPGVPVPHVLHRLLEQAQDTNVVSAAYQQHDLSTVIGTRRQVPPLHGADDGRADVVAGESSPAELAAQGPGVVVPEVLFASSEVTVTEKASGNPVPLVARTDTTLAAPYASEPTESAVSQCAQLWLESTLRLLRHGMVLTRLPEGALWVDAAGQLTLTDLRALELVPSGVFYAVEQLLWSAQDEDLTATGAALRTIGVTVHERASLHVHEALRALLTSGEDGLEPDDQKPILTSLLDAAVTSGTLTGPLSAGIRELTRVLRALDGPVDVSGAFAAAANR